MRHLLICAVMLILGASLVVAQDDCGDGLPCGKIPWSIPPLPQVESPTPMPTIGVTISVPTQTPGGATATPAPTSTPNLDTSGISDQMGTLQSVMASTPLSVSDLNGTPVNTDDTFTELGSNAGTFFGYIRTISTVGFGQMTPLVSFAFIAMVVVISIKASGFIIPLGAAIFGIIRKVIGLILDFLPL